MATVDLPHLDPGISGVDAWVATWLRALPALALIGPGSWFVAALIRAAGIGTLDGGLDWISGPEGLIMSLGVSFFAATYILFGMVVARRAARSGVAVTGPANSPILVGGLPLSLPPATGARAFETLNSASGSRFTAVHASLRRRLRAS